MSDKYLREMVLEELDFEPSVNAAHIGVGVENGIVTLSGHVWSYAEKMAAEVAVKRVKGVRGIAEEIEVRYPTDKKTADDEIARRAVAIAALKRNADVEADAVRVSVEGDRVKLEGKVKAWYERHLIEQAAWSVPGVRAVDDDLTLR